MGAISRLRGNDCYMKRSVGMLGFLYTMAKLPMSVRAKIKMGNLMVLRMNPVLLQCNGRSLKSPIRSEEHTSELQSPC